MIDLRRSDVFGENEKKLSNQLTKEGIQFRFGDIRLGEERQKSVFITDKNAITFSPISPGIESELRRNKFKPQVWHGSELRWQELELRRRLLLHR